MERNAPAAVGGEQEGQVLGGRYRLGRRLGSGSFGNVYEGHHTSLAQRVAIKVFRKDFVAMAGGPDRVLVDAKAAARVHHRNIVDVHDLGRVDDTVYVATELVLGGTLHAQLVRTGRLPWSRARGIALQIAAALKAAHKREVLHRGLRAANCFVLEDPEDASREPRIKVSDFGFAHPGLAGGGRGEEHTSPFVGDASYTAPELASKVAASVQSDVYAFGVLLYRMLTGVLPFEGGTPYQVLAAHVSRPVPSLREKVRSLSAELEAIVLRALAKEPGERFESMRELELALEEVEAREGEDARDEAAPAAGLDEAATGQHQQARPPEAPAARVRDEAMHAAFERRDEPGEVPTSMFDRRNLTPYFGPVNAAEAPPEPTIMLGAAMFSQMGAPAYGHAGAYAYGQGVAPASAGAYGSAAAYGSAGAYGSAAVYGSAAAYVQAPAASPAPAAASIPAPAPGYVPEPRLDDAPQRFAFPQLMPGVQPQASAFSSLPASPEPVARLGAQSSGMPEPTTLLDGYAGRSAAGLADPTSLLSPSVGGAGAPADATTLLSSSPSRASAASVPPTLRLHETPSPDAFVDGPTTSFPARAALAVGMQRGTPSPSSVVPTPSPVSRPVAPVPAAVAAPAMTPMPVPIVPSSPALTAAPRAVAYAARPASVPAGGLVPVPQGAPAPRSFVPPHPASHASAPAATSVSPASVAIVGGAVVIAGAIVGFALACPARAAASDASMPLPSTPHGAANHAGRSSRDW